jgi:hypothetical protein
LNTSSMLLSTTHPSATSSGAAAGGSHPSVAHPYVRIPNAPPSTQNQPQGSCRPTRRRHLPSAVRPLRPTCLPPLPASWSRSRSVLVWLLLGLPATHHQLLRRQAPPTWRRGACPIQLFGLTPTPLQADQSLTDRRMTLASTLWTFSPGRATGGPAWGNAALLTHG